MVNKDKKNFYIFQRGIEASMPWKFSDVFFIYVLIIALSIIFIGILLYSSVDINMGLFISLFQLAISFATVGLVYAVVSIKYQMPFKEALGLDFSKTPYYIRQGLFAAVIILLSTTFISYMFSNFGVGGKQNPYVELSEDRLRAVIFLAVFIAPIMEEIFFRGFMQPALVKNLGAGPGILITAIIFGISHTQYQDYYAALTAVITIGLILGITKHTTNSIMPGIFAHLVNNILAVISILAMY